MGYLEGVDKTTNLIQTGDANPAGLIGTIALFTVAMGVYAIQSIVKVKGQNQNG